MDWKSIWVGTWTEHRGRTIGALAGLLFGLLAVLVGFWAALFVFFCTGVGVVIGKFYDDPPKMRRWLERILGGHW